MSTKPREQLPPVTRYILSATSGIIVISLTHPFDLMKSRMQLSGVAGGKVLYKGPWHCFQTVVHREGFLGLYQGLEAAWFRQLTYTATRLSAYTYFNETYKEVLMREPSLLANMVMGLVAGAVAAVVGTPADLILIRMTTDGQLPRKERRNYKNVSDALWRISREEGVLNMWRGCMPTIMRAMVINMSQLPLYSYFRRQFKIKFHLSEGLPLQAAASIATGMLTPIFSLPVDILKTRMQNQQIIDGKPVYNGTMDVLAKLVKYEGFPALWKGFVPYFIRIAPQTVLILLVFEEQCHLYMKYVMGIGGKTSSF